MYLTEVLIIELFWFDSHIINLCCYNTVNIILTSTQNKIRAHFSLQCCLVTENKIRIVCRCLEKCFCTTDRPHFRPRFRNIITLHTCTVQLLMTNQDGEEILPNDLHWNISYHRTSSQHLTFNSQRYLTLVGYNGVHVCWTWECKSKDGLETWTSVKPPNTWKGDYTVCEAQCWETCWGQKSGINPCCISNHIKVKYNKSIISKLRSIPTGQFQTLWCPQIQEMIGQELHNLLSKNRLVYKRQMGMWRNWGSSSLHVHTVQYLSL